MPEPRVRKDGRCARKSCKRQRNLESPKGTQYRNHAELLAGDPFCSAGCARAHYGVVLSSAENEQASQAAQARRAREKEES